MGYSRFFYFQVEKQNCPLAPMYSSKFKLAGKVLLTWLQACETWPRLEFG
jgi:hypothetical protein